MFVMLIVMLSLLLVVFLSYWKLSAVTSTSYAYVPLSAGFIVRFSVCVSPDKRFEIFQTLPLYVPLLIPVRFPGISFNTVTLYAVLGP